MRSVRAEPSAGRDGLGANCGLRTSRIVVYRSPQRPTPIVFLSGPRQSRLPRPLKGMDARGRGCVKTRPFFARWVTVADKRLGMSGVPCSVLISDTQWSACPLSRRNLDFSHSLGSGHGEAVVGHRHPRERGGPCFAYAAKGSLLDPSSSLKDP